MVKFNKAFRSIERGIDSIIKVAFWCAAGVATLMMLLIDANIFSRYLFQKPLLGTMEVTELAIVIVVFCVVAYAEQRRSHIAIDALTSRLAIGVRTIMASVIRFVFAVFFAFAAWQLGLLMWTRMSPIIHRTDILSIPIWPFMLVMALGSLLLSLKLVLNAIHDLSSPVAGEGEEREIGGID